MHESNGHAAFSYAARNALDRVVANVAWTEEARKVWMRSIDICVPIVLATSSSTAELWWDALECGIDDILPENLVTYRLCQLLETPGAS